MINVLYGLVGFAGGILGGMGMGGGTILIPLLYVCFGLGQHISQAINLISFIPMAVFALIIHIKNKLVVFRNIFLIIIPGLITCLVFCFVSKQISGDILRKIFGCFLIVLSIFQVVFLFKKG